jgi:hypothetical protein
VAVYQDIDPQCARYLEFWYVATAPIETQIGVTIFYSDGFSYVEYLTSKSIWTEVHIDLDTSKQVSSVRVFAGYGYEMHIDDFDLEACPAVGGELLLITTPLIAVEIITVAAAAVASLMLFGYSFTNTYSKA